MSPEQEQIKIGGLTMEIRKEGEVLVGSIKEFDGLHIYADDIKKLQLAMM